MKDGKWVRCLETVTVIFKKGNYYPVSSSFYQGKVILIDELGNSVGFDIADYFFRDHFKLIESQKRGTSWATRRQQ